MSIFGPGRLVKENALIDVEALSITQVEGGTVQSYTLLTANVPVLMTLFNGGRNTTFASSQTDRVTISGVDDSLRRRDIRIKVVTAPTTMSQYADDYFAVDSSVPHPAGLGGLLNARTTLLCSRLDLPQVG